MKKENKNKISIHLPNLLMIPILSIAMTMIKLFGGVSWNWAVVLIITPMLIYIAWSLFMIFSVFLCIFLNNVANILKE